MVAKRRDRLKQFDMPPGGNFAFISFYPDLVSSAWTLLHRALLDRHQFAKNSQTHGSAHGPGAIVLQVTGFDVWMGELLATMFLSYDEARRQLDRPIIEKFRFLYEKNHPGEQLPPESQDLQIAVQVRDEIVHHFIRPNPKLVPDWLVPLQERGLLITSTHADVDFSFSAKLGSYALAYWVFEVIEACVRTINVPATDHVLKSFGQYRGLCAPSDLHLFDAQAH